MVLECIVKYLMATVVLFIAVFVGWFFSAKYLDPLIGHVLNPESHDKHMDIWFSMFVLIELVILFVYAAYVYKLYKSR